MLAHNKGFDFSHVYRMMLLYFLLVLRLVAEVTTRETSSLAIVGTSGFLLLFFFFFVSLFGVSSASLSSFSASDLSTSLEHWDARTM